MDVGKVKEYVASAALMETKLGIVVIAEVDEQFESSSLAAIRFSLHDVIENSEIDELAHRDLLILEAYLAVLDASEIVANHTPLEL